MQKKCSHMLLWIKCGYPHLSPQLVGKYRPIVDNSFEWILIISKKSLVFKAFSGRGFEPKMKVIHKTLADVSRVVHNMLWCGG